MASLFSFEAHIALCVGHYWRTAESPARENGSGLLHASTLCLWPDTLRPSRPRRVGRPPHMSRCGYLTRAPRGRTGVIIRSCGDAEGLPMSDALALHNRRQRPKISIGARKWHGGDQFPAILAVRVQVVAGPAMKADLRSPPPLVDAVRPPPS